MEHEPGPVALDRAVLETMPAPASTYIQDRESQWETALGGANAKADDALEACTDYNRRLAETR